jgi:glycosyltransferase involved in cell wall biosynthesis
VPAVLKPLSEAQNEIEGVEARVLSVRYKQDDYFDTLEFFSMEQYIDKYCPDIVLFHTFYFIEYVKLARILKKKNIPFLIEPHGSFGKQAVQKSWFKKTVANHTIFRSLLKDSLAIVYTNKGEANDSIFKNMRFVIIPNGVDENVVNNSSNKKGELPIFYFLGRFSIHHKGLDYLLDALRILDNKNQDLTVFLYGMGDESAMRFINDRINSLKNIKVSIKGTIFGQEKVNALEEANILLLTSRYEGSPMTVLDAMSYGNPCIVTPGTNVAEEVCRNGVGWNCELDAYSIADTIIKAKEEYLANKDNYIRRCKSYVKDNYAWSKIAQLSIKEYQLILNKNGK